MNEKGEHEINFLVRGVHCAMCIQKIESGIKTEDDVIYTRLNFSTGRLNISWSGDAARANDFAAIIENLGYGVHPYDPETEKNTDDAQNRFLLMCLGIAGFAMGNIMLLSVGLWVTDAETMGGATRDLLHWVSALIAIPAILFSGRPFFRSALSVLKQGQTNMDVPISIALILATGMSLFETAQSGEHVYFDSAVMLMFFLLVGRYLDYRARRNAKSAATDLLQTLSGFATVITPDGHKRVLIRDLTENMQVFVAAGEKIPVDGIIDRGQSTIDTSLITGETLPRDAAPGDHVYGGTINQSAPLYITVTKAAQDSLLADIVRLMERAEQGQAKYVRLADRAAKLYTPVVHFLAFIAFITWFGFWGAQWQDALLIAVTVLIITCPCALGLAVPVVQVLANGSLMRRGILVKSGDALEKLAKIDTVLFDKTGTLTLGEPSLIGTYDIEALRIASSLASHSRHPLSIALARHASDSDNSTIRFDHVTEHAGSGLEAELNGKTVRLGKRSWCGDANARTNENTELWLNIDGQIQGCFSFEDSLKTDAKDVVQTLIKDGFDPILISGDRHDVVAKTAKELGITSFYADQTPTQKHDILQGLKDNGKTILMVGDGLNDAPVLAAADISIAPGSAVDMAQNAADIIVMGEKLHPVYEVYKTAKKSNRLVQENFVLAVIYNCIAIPLAFAGLVTPMIAALAMSGSSLLVIVNSYRLKLRS